MNLLGIRIYNYRKKLDMTLAQAASNLISISYLSKIETGAKSPSLETTIDLQERLEMPTITIDLDDILCISLLAKYESLFQLLLSEKKDEVKEQLLKIGNKHNLTQFPVEIELSHQLILATTHTVLWEIDKAEAIEGAYLSVLPKFSQEKIPPYIKQYLSYFQARKAFHTTQYTEAIEHYTECITDCQNDTLISTLCTFCAIAAMCVSNYELSESYLDHAKKLLLQLPITSQERIIQLHYLEGFILFQIKYFSRAEQAFLEAKSYYLSHPDFAQIFNLLIEFYLYLLYVESNDEKSVEQFNVLYQLLEEKKGEYIPNDYLVINELMILLAEQDVFDKSIQLREILRKEEYAFGEFQYSIPYFDALLARYHGNITEYEHSILNLLDIIEQSNEPKLIARVQQQASKHFVKKKKYKSALNALGQRAVH